MMLVLSVLKRRRRKFAFPSVMKEKGKGRIGGRGKTDRRIDDGFGNLESELPNQI